MGLAGGFKGKTSSDQQQVQVSIVVVVEKMGSRPKRGPVHGQRLTPEAAPETIQPEAGFGTGADQRQVHGLVPIKIGHGNPRDAGGGDSQRGRDVLEGPVAQIAEELVGVGVIGVIDIDIAGIIEISGHQRQGSA